MKKFSTFITILFVIFLNACHIADSKKKEASNTDSTQISQIVGNDSDAHGCKASAGYLWSEVKKDCIRIFEVEHIILTPTANALNKEENLIVLFDEQKSKSEVFLPNSLTILLSKTADKTWTKDSFELTENKGFSLKINGKESYHSK